MGREIVGVLVTVVVGDIDRGGAHTGGGGVEGDGEGRAARCRDDCRQGFQADE